MPEGVALQKETFILFFLQRCHFLLQRSHSCLKPAGSDEKEIASLQLANS